MRAIGRVAVRAVFRLSQGLTWSAEGNVALFVFSRAYSWKGQLGTKHEEDSLLDARGNGGSGLPSRHRDHRRLYLVVFGEQW